MCIAEMRSVETEFKRQSENNKQKEDCSSGSKLRSEAVAATINLNVQSIHHFKGKQFA